MRVIGLITCLCLSLQAQAFSVSSWSDALSDDKLQTQERQFEILFFYLSTCPYCHKLAPLVYREAQDLKIEVKEISADAKPVDGKEFYVDYDLIKKLNIRTYPSVYLLNKNTNKAFEITSNFINQAELGKRFSIAIMKDMGEQNA